MYSLSQTNSHSWLTWFFKGLLVLAIFILIARLTELQIIKGAYYRDLAEGNRVRKVPIAAPRGRILARGGEVLVDNVEVRKTVVFDRVSGFEKKPVVPGIPEEDTFKEWSRQYPLGPVTAHITGYLGEANTEEVGKVDPSCTDKGVRKLGSLVGRSGLEVYYDCLLRGADGEELVEVDTFGDKVRTLGRKPPVAGKDIYTTIDYRLQKEVAKKMEGKTGSVVITDGHGEVLALYSSPSYDPNIFVSGKPEDKSRVSEALSDPSLPMFDRVVGGAYHPGSIYKIVTSIAALEDGVISKDYTYVDTGAITVNEFSYKNWYFTQYGSTEGEIDLVRALARSTDTFFYEVGDLVGIDRLVLWTEKFGLGKKTGIDLPGEIEGLVPSPAWKRAVKGERWFLGNTYHMSIGQGDLTTTPLQANGMASVIANGGKLCQPRLVKNSSENLCKSLEIDNSSIALVKEGMVGACSTGGTAYPFFDFTPQVACKTGTAETGEKDTTHAWFTVIAPAENPELVVTILVEKGGEGSKVAAPIAREILDYWNLSKNP